MNDAECNLLGKKAVRQAFHTRQPSQTKNGTTLLLMRSDQYHVRIYYVHLQWGNVLLH